MEMRYLNLFFSFPEDTELLTDAQRGRLVVAMVRYARNGEQPVLEGNEKFLWPLHKGQIDRTAEQLKKYSEKQKENGSKGGRPRKANALNENPKNPVVFEETQNTEWLNQKPKKASIPIPIPIPITTPITNTNRQGDLSPYNPPSAKQQKRFVKPSLQEIRSYISEKGYTFSADSFFAFYQSNGWKVGRNPMRDWRQACVTWQSRQGMKSAPAAKQVNAQRYEQRTNDLDGAFTQFTQEQLQEMMKDE